MVFSVKSVTKKLATTPVLIVMQMKNVHKREIIFEPTGDYMTFRYEAESDNEADLCNEIGKDF